MKSHFVDMLPINHYYNYYYYYYLLALPVMVLSALSYHTNIATYLVLISGLYTLLFIVERSTWSDTQDAANMQQIKLNYSLKNIGLPTHNTYLRNLIDKTESFVQRIRWKAHFFLHGNESTRTDRNNTYGLKSKRCAPPVKEFKPFEDDLANMIESVKLRNVYDGFMEELEKDKRKINASKNVFVFADKTRNFYVMDAPARS